MKDLIGIEGLAPAQIAELLDAAERFVGTRSTVSALAGRVVANLFFENSTRTLLSFELAAKRLGATVLIMAVERSSVAKGESFLDTLRTVEAIGADAIVLRHSRSGAAAEAGSALGCAVVNAGDGSNEHPTQALIDALALRRRFGGIAGLTVAIVGDIAHSRVARSNAILLEKMGAHVRLAGPPDLMPPQPPAGARVCATARQAVEGADAVMMLRVQRERLESGLEMSGAEYFDLYGIDHARLANAAPRAVVLHPGPMNREVEIAGALADDRERSLILDQVALGVPVRMACLERVLGAAV